MPTDPYADIASPVSQAKADPYGDIASPVSAPKPEDWQARIVKVPALDPQGRKIMVDQREDGGTWRGPAEGNTGKPGWFDANGMRLGDAPGQRPGLIDRQINGGLDQQRHPIASVIRQMGDIPVVPGAIQIEGSPVNGPTLAGFAKGASSLVTAPLKFMGQAAQYVRNHDTRLFPMAAYDQHDPEGITASTNLPDDLAQKIYSENFNKNLSGEIAGQVAPFLYTGGASALEGAPQVLSAAQRVKAALMSLPKVLPKASATGAGYNAMLAPHAPGQTNEQFMAQAGEDAKFGGKVGLGLGAVAPVVEGVSAIRQKLGEVAKIPSASELLDTIGVKLGGKSPGVALQDAANKVYDDAWQKFTQAITPVDEAAAKTKVDYSPAIKTLQETLGIGVDREPMALTEEGEKVLRRVYSDVESAMKPDSGVTNSFKGAMNLVKRLGAAERKLAQVHGDLDARDALSAAKNAVLDSMEQSDPALAGQFKSARQVFADEVAPLFSKSEGGDILTKIRDSARPDDLVASLNQGALTRMKVDLAKDVTRGASADPLLYSFLDAAIKQGAGKPGSFASSIEKAMPAIEQIADPGTLEAFKGMLKVAKTAKWTGAAINLAAAGSVGHANAGLGASAGVLASFNPALTGPGIIWKMLQSPTTRKLLSFASKLPAGSPELELIARDLAKTATAAPAAGKAFSNVQPFNPPPAAADTGTANERASQ